MSGGSVVLASGGIDSSLCIALAARSGGPVLALGIDYGQRNQIELDRLAAVAARLGVETLIVNIDMAGWLSGGLIGRDAAGPDPAATNYVPARNIILLSIAASVAEARGADRIYLGATAADWRHPDCRPTFFAAFAAALKLGQDSAPDLRTPLAGLSKTQVVRAALTFGVPLELTWSCHMAGPVPCGICAPCGIRQETFAELGLPAE
jgi:7-cyano-7-deazaguanine synthase